MDAVKLEINEPSERAIFQRGEEHRAKAPLLCLCAGEVDRVEARVLDCRSRATVLEWTVVPRAKEKDSFRAALDLAGGWYRLEVRALRHGEVVGSAAVSRVGVGEVLLTCGQSNSANHGQPPQKAGDDRVSSCDFATGRWRHADDPQPGASGEGGSPWPALGDLLAEEYQVPVGFFCVGVGGTPVVYWTAQAHEGAERIKAALQRVAPRGVRSVLWHQGESDSIAGTSADDYAKMLKSVILQSRKEAGFDVPWGVALASYHPAVTATAEYMAGIIAGQRKVIAETPGVFKGPETDTYSKRGFLCDSVHFNEKGLAAHAQGWLEALKPIIGRRAEPIEKRKRP